MSSFKVLSATDKEYVDSIRRVDSTDSFTCSKVSLGILGTVESKNITLNPNIMAVLENNVRLIDTLIFYFNDYLQVTITRDKESNSIFDRVSVSRPLPTNSGYHGNQRQYNEPTDNLQLATLEATLQKELDKSTTLLGVGNLLGPAVQAHLEAREAALARLERATGNLLHEMEDVRKRRDDELESRTKKLEADLDEKRHALQDEIQQQREQLERQKAEQEALRRELDDRAAKHARRQHYKDIKQKFASWSTSFSLTSGTNNLRRTVYWFTIILLFIFGGLAGYFLFVSISAQDALHIYPAIAKQVTFTTLFVTTAYYFIRWNNQWFQRHANEEFHLKRLELDIDRASWFVEMAFEWKEEKGEDIPDALIDRLTHGLFGDVRGDTSVEPSDSLVQALLGASRFKVKLPGDIEAEYDRKGVQKLAREEKKRVKDKKGDEKA